ncbi:MAG: hypothetical protein APR54_08770 [Candidatus Cloacimonas sp. SDB]|nr:MAG: hypothetical protein APR54_08770 [Candidatus Cloacimonas sp. SDB]
MGKIVIIMVMVITAILGTIMFTVNQRSEKIPEILASNYQDLGSYALQYAIQQVSSGNITSSTTIEYSADNTFEVMDGTINSLTYIITSVEEDGEGSSLPNDPYSYAIATNGTMKWSGSGSLNVGEGNIHSNGKFTMTGSKKITGNISSSTEIKMTGSTKISGDAAAPVVSFSGSAISGTVTIEAVDQLIIPDIDLTSYYEHAQANGQVFDGNQQFSGSGNLEPAGGIMWVNGDIRISGSNNMIGCFIATGSIKISGSGDQTKVDNFPAFISRDSDIDISGSGKSHGLIYAGQDFDKSGSGDHIGSILSKGNFKSSGSWSVLTYENSKPNSPDVEEGSEVISQIEIISNITMNMQGNPVTHSGRAVLQGIGTEGSEDEGGGYSIFGSLNINPGNSANNEFQVHTPDGGYFSRDEVHQNAPQFSYNGPASIVRVRPKAQGRTLTINGTDYTLANTRYEIVSDNMTINVWNDKLKNGKAMGKWWISIDAVGATIDPDITGGNGGGAGSEDDGEVTETETGYKVIYWNP